MEAIPTTDKQHIETATEKNSAILFCGLESM